MNSIEKLKLILFKVAFVCITFSLPVQFLVSQNNPLNFTTDLDAALIQANENNKTVLVNIFSTENYGSREMDKLIYSNNEVKDLLNTEFIYVKLNLTYEIRPIARKYTIYYAPTTIFLDPSGMLLHRIDGYVGVDEYIKSAKYALKNPIALSQYYEKNYKQNKENSTFLRSYIEHASEINAHQKKEKLIDQYLKLIHQIPKIEWMTFVKENVNKEDSKLFEVLTENKAEFSKMFGTKEINNKQLEILIQSVYNRSTKKLLNQTIKKLKKYNVQITADELLPTIARFIFDSRFKSNFSKSRTELGIRILKDYREKVDNSILRNIISDISVSRDDKMVLSLANQVSSKMLEAKPTAYLHDLKSILLYKLGQVDNAYAHIELAKALSEKSNNLYFSSLELMKETGRIK